MKHTKNLLRQLKKLLDLNVK